VDDFHEAWRLSHQNVVDRLQRGQNSRTFRWERLGAWALIDSLRTGTISKSYDQQIAKGARTLQEPDSTGIKGIEVRINEANFASGAAPPIEFARQFVQEANLATAARLNMHSSGKLFAGDDGGPVPGDFQTARGIGQGGGLRRWQTGDPEKSECG